MKTLDAQKTERTEPNTANETRRNEEPNLPNSNPTAHPSENHARTKQKSTDPETKKTPKKPKPEGERWGVEKEGNLALGDDAAALAEDGGGEPDLLADHDVVLVVGVVGVPQLPVGPELELQELVPELPLVSHVVPYVELRILLLVLRHLPLSPALSPPLWFEEGLSVWQVFVKMKS